MPIPCMPINLDHLEERFLKRHKSPKLTQKEIDHLNKPMKE